MARTHAFAVVELTNRFKKSYAKLSVEVADQCDDALADLVRDPLSPGLRIKPIRPSNVYYEARVNRSDRLIIYPVSNTAYVMDIVTHNEITKWGNESAPDTG